MILMAADFFDKFDAGEFIGLVAVGGGILLGMILGLAGIIAGYFEEVRKTEMEAALKQDMLNRGMAADDIALVIRAKKGMKDRDLNIVKS